MIVTFHLHHLGHRIKYVNLVAVNTTQQLLLTIRPCCSSELIESSLFWVILVTYNVGIFICIYIYKGSYICSFLVIFNLMFFLHCMLNILRYEKIFFETDESIASQHDPSTDAIFLGVHSESSFLFFQYFFLQKAVLFGLLVSCLSLS